MSGRILREHDEAVLRSITYKPLSIPFYSVEFQSMRRLMERFKDKEKLLASLEKLVSLNYVEKVDQTLQNGAHFSGYQITAIGLNYLERPQQTSGASYHVRGNANIAHNSPGATQTISIETLDTGLKRKVSKLEEAVKSKDKNKILQILSHIGDKSLDLLIAIVAGRLVK